MMAHARELSVIEHFWLYQKRADWNFSSLSSFSSLFLTFLGNRSNFQASPAKQNGTGWLLKIFYTNFNILGKYLWCSNINNKKKETLLQRCLSAHALCISCLGQKFSILLMKPISYKAVVSCRHCVLMNFSQKKKEKEKFWVLREEERKAQRSTYSPG